MAERVTPEMLEAGKNVLYSHGAVLNAAAHSIPDTYLAMRELDPEWVRIQEAAKATSIPNADDFLIGDGCVMAFSHWVGHELAPILRERGLWSGERDPLDKLRDMAALSHAAINAMHSWNARAEGDAQ